MLNDAGKKMRQQLEGGDGQAEPHHLRLVGLVGAASFAADLAKLAQYVAHVAVERLQAAAKLDVDLGLPRAIVRGGAQHLIRGAVVLVGELFGGRAARAHLGDLP
jgi:hypothetical protein